MAPGVRGDSNHRRIIASNFTRDASRWSEEYVRADFNSRRYQLRAAIALRMLDSLGSGRGRLLDMGTGAGLQARAAYDRGWDVVAMDLTPAMIEQARVQVGPRWLVASADAPPVRPGSADVVLMLGLIGYLPDPALALQAAQACLRDGGHLIVSCHNRPTLFSLVNRATKWLPRQVAGLVRLNGTEHADQSFYTVYNRSFSPSTFGRLLADHGFEILDDDAIDYGRLRPFGLQFPGDRFDIRASQLLESLARRRRFQWLKRYAFMHVFLVRKAS